MQWILRGLFVFLFVLSSSGCSSTAQKVLNVKAEFSVTAEWKKSEHAFKTIMRNYVHGRGSNISEAQLDADFKMYVSLTTDDVREFLKQQTCLPRAGTTEARYYMANSTHQRHDAHFATNQPAHHMAGSGHKKAHATFTANLLLERHELESGETFPSRARMKGSPFPDWKTLESVLSKRSAFDKEFHFKEESQADEVFEHTSKLDFSSVNVELFIAPKLYGGSIFSPALFAVYVLRPTQGAAPAVYTVVSANAQGEPQTTYVGLVEGTDAPYKSETGFAFTYLSTAKNLLDYKFVLTKDKPLSFEVWITTAFPDHPDSPYLTVRSSFVPAVDQETVRHYRESPMTRLILMIRKGALMRDLIKLYYPGSKAVELWNDVGAIHGTKFKQKLEALGLDLAVGLFDRDLWLEKPKAGTNAPLEFKVSPDAIKECPAH